MFGIVNYGTFVVSSVLLNLTPGSDTIYILSRGIAGGRKQGIASAFGISTGILLHTLLAAFGLSAVLASSTLAFTIMKILGAAYLVFMGVCTLFAKNDVFSLDKEEKQSFFTVFRQGVLTNALNPKVALFFLALLPQFVDPNQPYGPLPFVLLGLTFFATSTLWCLVLAMGASLVNRWLTNPKVSRVATKLSGVVYILLGLNLLRAKASI